MTDDLVKRLRGLNTHMNTFILDEAADLIEKLEAAVLMEKMVCPKCNEWSHNIYCGPAPPVNTSAERVKETGEI
jgi:hypothetical protein